MVCEGNVMRFYISDMKCFSVARSRTNLFFKHPVTFLVFVLITFQFWQRLDAAVIKDVEDAPRTVCHVTHKTGLHSTRWRLDKIIMLLLCGIADTGIVTWGLWTILTLALNIFKAINKHRLEMEQVVWEGKTTQEKYAIWSFECLSINIFSPYPHFSKQTSQTSC